MENKSMLDYTLYCTESQTRKALGLGAPILAFKNAFGSKEIPYFTVRENNEWTLYVCPTAEQMIGWLEEQVVVIDVAPYSNHKGWSFYINGEFYLTDDISRKEATLAAIDAALDYLSKKGE